MPPTLVSGSIGFGPPGPQRRRRAARRAGSLRELAGRPRAELLQRRRVAIDRMAAPVEAERLLLEGELLGLGPRRRVGQQGRPEAVALRTRPTASAPNSCACPSFAIALQPRAVLAGRVDRREQPRPQRRRRQRLRSGVPSDERVERAGLDEALEHALVDEPQIEILAERVQRRDAALLLPHLEQRLDRRPRRRS